MSSGTGDTTLVFDNFNRSDESPIASPWVSGPGVHGDLNLAGNNVEPAALSTSCVGRYDAGAKQDQWASTQVTTRSLSNAIFGTCVRINSPTDGDLYYFGVNYGIDTCRLARNDDTGTLAGADLVSGGTFAVGDIMEARMIGTLLAGVQNGSYILSVLDATYATGQPGILSYAEASSTDLEVDNFSAGNISPTRFYFPSVAGTVPITPTQDAGWGDVEDLVRRAFYPYEVGSAAADLVCDEAVTTNPLNVLAAQYICPMPLEPGQTIQGTVRGIIRCLESIAAADMCAQWCWKVWNQSGTTVATLLALGTHTLTEEPGTTTINRRFPVAFNNCILTPYTVPVDGNTYYIGCELGCRSFNTVSTNRTWTMALGDPAGVADCAEDITGTTGVAWAELDCRLAFKSVVYPPNRTMQHIMAGT